MGYSVYWIHLLDHTDPYTEGYIGITANDPVHRLRRHVQINPTIREGVSQGAIQTVLREGLRRSEALSLERSYRPKPHIGWNKAKGGGAGLSYPGYNHTPEQVKANSERGKKQYASDPDMPERLRKNLDKGRYRSPSQEEKNRISQKLMRHEVKAETRNKISKAAERKPKVKCEGCGGMFHPYGLGRHQKRCLP
jgi:hypothetical protein